MEETKINVENVEVENKDENVEAETFTKEQMDKEIGRASQLGKNELLKKLGIPSVDKFKAEQEGFQKWKVENQSENEKQSEIIEKYKTQEIETNEKLFNLETNNISLKLGVKPEYLKKVVTLAKAEIKANEKISVEDAIKQVINEVPVFISKEEKVDIKIGAEKGSGNTQKTESEHMKAFKRLRK